MDTQLERLLFISGPVGVGKTTVAKELSVLLKVDSLPHTFIDLDALTYTFPRSTRDPFGNELGVENLVAIWKNCRKRGSKNLIVPRVIETRDYAEKISASVGVPNPIVCLLTASEKVLVERIRTREIGSNLAWHEKRSIQLANAMEQNRIEDFSVATDQRSVTEIATEILGTVNWSR